MQRVRGAPSGHPTAEPRSAGVVGAGGTLPLKAAALLRPVVGDHALVDGNERPGWLATVVVLDLNGEHPDPGRALGIEVGDGGRDPAGVVRRFHGWSLPAPTGPLSGPAARAGGRACAARL